MISVVTVNFNAGPLLARSVRAALASTEPVEVIVVDNGSTDGSVEALRAELGGDPRLRHLGPDMADRMNSDQCFDSAEARRDFGYAPRPFDAVAAVAGIR